MWTFRDVFYVGILCLCSLCYLQALELASCGGVGPLQEQKVLLSVLLDVGHICLYAHEEVLLQKFLEGKLSESHTPFIALLSLEAGSP